jgi:hypothetical protein
MANTRYVDVPVLKKLRHTPYVVNSARWLAERDVGPKGWSIYHSEIRDFDREDIVFLRCYLEQADPSGAG